MSLIEHPKRFWLCELGHRFKTDPGKWCPRGDIEDGLECGQAVIEYVQAERLRGAVEAAKALARWTQHAPDCARRQTTADDCTCGLQEAWASLDDAGGRYDAPAASDEKEATDG